MTQPAVHVSESSVSAVMCGTSNLSRTRRTPLRGTFSTRQGHCPLVPKRSDLKSRCTSSLVTWSKRGVSASYMRACRSAPSGTGNDPGWPDGTMFSEVDAKSVVAAAADAGTRRHRAAAASAARRTGRDMGGHLNHTLTLAAPTLARLCEAGEPDATVTSAGT